MLVVPLPAALIAASLFASDVDWSLRLRLPVASQGRIVRDSSVIDRANQTNISSTKEEYDLIFLMVGRRFAGRWMADVGAGWVWDTVLRFQSTVLAGRTFALSGDPIEHPDRASLELQLLGGLLYRHRGRDLIHSNGIVGQVTPAATAQVGLDITVPTRRAWRWNFRASCAGSHALFTYGPSTWHDKEGPEVLESYAYGLNFHFDAGVTF